MKISWNWLSEMLDLSTVGGPEGLADLLTRRGLEVEAIEYQNQGLEKVVTARILEKAPHPQADRLSLCKVSTGAGAPLEIVCGAQNMKAGDTVALAQVGAHLPNGVEIAQSKIRGVVSNGMLCSLEELKLAEASSGILILAPETPLGKPLAEVLGRDDVILVFKLTANRGDCLGHFGMAREVGAALGQKPNRPEAPPLALEKCPIAISLDAGEKAPEFWGCALEGVKIGPSPAWLVKRLEALGSRSINNVVDATNYVMLELGHPMHAYDADRIEGKKIHVRMANSGETLPLLDGTTVTLAGTELVIADEKRAVGLAGVMGGGNSEVRPETSRLFLECAQFSPSLVRRAAASQGKRTEAAHRFERGVDPGGLAYAIARLAHLILELAGGKIVGSASARLESGAQIKKREIRVNPTYFEEFLGMPAPAPEARKILEALECQIREEGKEWGVSPPSYRLDLSLKQDLAEEVARSIGYERIRETLPPLTSSPKSIFAAQSASRLGLMEKAKDLLSSEGLHEAIHFAFTSKQTLTRFGMGSSVILKNPLSEEHEALVPSLIPALVQNALENWHHHFGSEKLAIRLFELRPAFQANGPVQAQGETETGVTENWKLALALSGPRLAQSLRTEESDIDFYDLKGILESLFKALGTKGVRFQPITSARATENPLLKLFHPGQSVEILAGKDVAGYFGLFHPSLTRELKLRAPLWLAELDWEAIFSLSRPVFEAPTFKPWSEFPPIERDFALVVKEDVTADKITQLALKAGKPLAKVAKIFDVYRGEQVSQGMTSLPVRVIFYEETRSLQESEAEEASARILESWKKELGAELRG